MINVALAGNPNTGKTSLFNKLTGSYEYVGNWTGVTVEKKVGVLKNKIGHLVDLPGVYSLNPLSIDEGVATQSLLYDDYSVILNIVDASQLERNLYLTIQLLEYGKPLVIGLNMMDVAEGRGLWIDDRLLSERLGCPVVPIVARSGAGCDELANKLSSPVSPQAPLVIDYGSIMEESIRQLTSMLTKNGESMFCRWLAVQFFEGNRLVRERLLQSISEAELDRIFAETEKKIRSQTNADSITAYSYNTGELYPILAVMLCKRCRAG